MKRYMSVLFTALVLLAVLVTSCRPAAPTPTPVPPTPVPPKVHPALADGKLTIAWIPKALNNPVFEMGRDGAIAKAKELTEKGPYQVEILYVGSVASDMAEQARVVEDVVAKGVDAIGISCNDPTGCVDPINKAIEAGKPVMTWDADSPDSKRFTYLGVSNYDGGKAAADLLIKAMGEKGKVALLTGVPGALNLEERMRGFKDFVKDYPGIEIVSTVACYDDIEKGVTVVEETMTAHPDLTGWFFVGLWPLFAEKGSMPLWEAAAKTGKLKTVAFDTLPVELDFMKEGYLQGLVGQKYWGWGYDTVQMIYDNVVSGKTFESWTDSGMDIVTPCNVDAMAEAWETIDFTKPLPPGLPCPEIEAKPPAAVKVVVIGKSVHPYWANVEKGTKDAAAKLGVEAIFWVPTKEDVAAQISTMETYIAMGVSGIAVAPSDPKALESYIKKAMDAGIPTITLDTDAPESVRLAYIGTDNYAAGVEAGKQMVKLLPEGGKVAIGTGSVTALNSIQRMEGFREAIKGTKITVVEPINNDKEDSATALDLAGATLVGHPDLAGAYGVYAYNGPAWAKAGKEAGKAGEVKIVAFDATPEHIGFVKEGVIHVLVAQREYMQGYKSVELLTLMAQKGIEGGMAEYKVPESKIVDTGVDVVTLDTLADYAATLDKLGIPREWKVE